MKDQREVLTPDEVRQRLIAAGVTINEWSRKMGYHHATVRAVLSGRMRCQHGLGHRIAVDLGLKAAPAEGILGERPLLSIRQEGAAA